jgi:hypothetical protein
MARTRRTTIPTPAAVHAAAENVQAAIKTLTPATVEVLRDMARLRDARPTLAQAFDAADYEAPIEKLIEACRKHGEESEPDHEVADLQALVRLMWSCTRDQEDRAHIVRQFIDDNGMADWLPGGEIGEVR